MWLSTKVGAIATSSRPPWPPVATLGTPAMSATLPSGWRSLSAPAFSVASRRWSLGRKAIANGASNLPISVTVNGAGAIGMLARPVVAGTFLISGSSGELRGTLVRVVAVPVDWALLAASGPAEQGAAAKRTNDKANLLLV